VSDRSVVSKLRSRAILARALLELLGRRFTSASRDYGAECPGPHEKRAPE
jgi:hypothetical protein